MGVSKVYALGFKTNLNDVTTYYICEDKDSNSLVLKLINELLRPKYKDITFYAHNLAGYDIIFILWTLYNHNDNNTDKYNISIILKDDKVIKVSIKKDGNLLVLQDSYCVLSSSLSKLGESFGVDTLKSVFPHEFSVTNNLFYEGNMPDIKYYKGISTEKYHEMYTSNLSFKNVALKYLEDDIKCLYEVVTKANKQVFTDYNVQLTESLTISGLALKIFLNNHYNKNIPMVNRASMYKDVREAYFGGITEVYKPIGSDLYYYDVNSLYPHVASQDMPGLSFSKIEYLNNNPNINYLFGFYYCRVKSP